MMKMKLIFTTITVAAYPLLVYVIMPYCVRFMVSGGSDHMGNAMEKGFTYIYGCMFFSAILFVLSMIVAHSLFRQWWIGLAASVLGLFILWAGFVAVESFRKYYDENRISKYVEYYETGEVMEKGRTRGGDKNGKVVEYYRDGTIKSIETYKRGKLFGSCELYHPSGKLMAKGNYKGNEWDNGDQIGIPDGIWSYYHKSGRLDDERTYTEGKLLSSKNFKLCFDSTGLVRTIAEGELFTGSLVKQGIVSVTYLFPNPYTAQVKNGEFDGELCSYYTIGDELVVASTATYRNGKKDGALKYYHTNGQLNTDAFYIDGNLEGIYTTYYADSVATEPHGKVKYRCNYKNGERHGTARWYNQDGTLNEETEYLEGERNGISRKYYPNGKLKCLYTYKNGEKDGAFESYHDNGEYEKGCYKNDNMTLRESYRSDSTLYSVYQWQNGECIRSDKYDENGKLR